jgi:hypothetical protein
MGVLRRYRRYQFIDIARDDIARDMRIDGIGPSAVALPDNLTKSLNS